MGEYGELLKKKMELEKKLAADNQAVEEEKLKQENERLESELKDRQRRIQTLEEQLEDKIRDKKNYDNNIAKLLGQLKDLESFASEEQKTAWTCLVRDFPEDAHEEKR